MKTNTIITALIACGLVMGTTALPVIAGEGKGECKDGKKSEKMSSTKDDGILKNSFLKEVKVDKDNVYNVYETYGPRIPVDKYTFSQKNLLVNAVEERLDQIKKDHEVLNFIAKRNLSDLRNDLRELKTSNMQSDFTLAKSKLQSSLSDLEASL